jgi:hypothetical protein
MTPGVNASKKQMMGLQEEVAVALVAGVVVVVAVVVAVHNLHFAGCCSIACCDNFVVLWSGLLFPGLKMHTPCLMSF